MRGLLGSAGGLAWLVVAACGSSVKHEGVASAGKAGAGGGDAAGRGGASGETSTGGKGGTSGRGGAGGSSPGGTGGDVDCSSEPDELDGQSFIVTFSSGGATWPDDLRTMVLHFQRAATGLEVVIGSPGQAFLGAVTPDGRRLAVEPGTRLRDNGNPYGWPVNNGVTLKSLSLCFRPPQDSSASLDGQGRVLIVRNEDDYTDEVEADVEFSGARWDDVAPALPESQLLDPLAPADVLVSEPLELGAVAALDDPAQTPLVPVEQAGTVVAFGLGTVLPLGFEARVGTDAKDLQGNRLAPGCLLRTDEDPGVQALDGFESELRVVDRGSARATLIDDARVLEGSRSLEIPGGGIALLHLARPSSGADHVRFDLKADPRLVEARASFFVRAGVVGGSKIVTRELPATPLHPSGEGGAGGEGGQGPGAGELHSIDLLLSEPGDDVLLEITAPFIEASASTDVGAIVDRLRIE